MALLAALLCRLARRECDQIAEFKAKQTIANRVRDEVEHRPQWSGSRQKAADQRRVQQQVFHIFENTRAFTTFLSRREGCQCRGADLSPSLVKLLPCRVARTTGRLALELPRSATRPKWRWCSNLDMYTCVVAEILVHHVQLIRDQRMCKKLNCPLLCCYVLLVQT